MAPARPSGSVRRRGSPRLSCRSGGEGNARQSPGAGRGAEGRAPGPAAALDNLCGQWDKVQAAACGRDGPLCGWLPAAIGAKLGWRAEPSGSSAGAAPRIPGTDPAYSFSAPPLDGEAPVLERGAVRPAWSPPSRAAFAADLTSPALRGPVRSAQTAWELDLDFQRDAFNQPAVAAAAQGRESPPREGRGRSPSAWRGPAGGDPLGMCLDCLA